MMLPAPEIASNVNAVGVKVAPAPPTSVAGTAIRVPISITQPSVAQEPMSRAERADASDEAAQQNAAPRPPTMASTSAKSARSAALPDDLSRRPSGTTGVGQARRPLLPCAFVLDADPCRAIPVLTPS